MNCRNLHILLLLMLTQGAEEFKSVKDVPPANFLEQFGKNLANSDVSDLSQIKWIFDGKKVTQDELTNAVNKAIDKLPDDIVQKWNLKNEKARKQLLDIFKVE